MTQLAIARRRALAVALAVSCVAASALAGCAEGDGGPTAEVTATTAGTTTAPETTAPATTGAASDAPVVEVTFVDYDFEGLPATVAAGTRLTATNRSTTEVHELVALRIPDDEQRSVEDLVGLPGDDLIRALGRVVPEVVLVAFPGEANLAGVGDDVLDEPGRYLVLCSLPVGADPEVIRNSDRYISGESPEEYADRPLHLSRGMFAELVVE